MNSSAGKLEAIANRIWYAGSWLYLPLLPLTWLFIGITALRRFAYRTGIMTTYRVNAPVVVIGNITVGGAGKTPVTLWLAQQLQSSGFKPAIISRGYGGKGGEKTLRVSDNSDPAIAGDEPVLLAKRSRLPVYVNKDRVRAAKAAAGEGANVIICDDGLQHYRLHRDAEIAVIDGERGLGNSYLLPAGPLREPLARLNSVDRVMLQVTDGLSRYGNRATDTNVTRFSLEGTVCRNLRDHSERPLSAFTREEVHAIAGIAHPERFFRALRLAGLDVIPHPHPDHATFGPDDVRFKDRRDVIMTEKDAVKCRAFANKRMWYLPVDAQLEDTVELEWLSELIERLMNWSVEAPR